VRPRALGATPARPVSAPPEPKKPPVTSMYAAVAERRPDGCATKLLLPGPTASKLVPYLFQEASGSWMQGAYVDAKGNVHRTDLGQPNPAPGTKLVAVVSPKGEVLCIQEHARART
jgi:hypothetical protein